jgi:tetratricopeptide (TPR) repeat protein
MGTGTGMPTREAHRLAREAALNALALDPNLSEAHASLAGVLLDEDWDFAGAERSFRRALDLNPNNVEARHQYAHFLLAVGRTDEALVEGRVIESLDPVSGLAPTHFGYHYLFTHQYDQAIHAFNQYFLIETDPGSHLMVGDAYYQKGLFQEAFDAHMRFHRHQGTGLAPEEVANLERAFAVQGMRGYLQARMTMLAARGRPEPNRFPMTSLAGQLASLSAQLGDRERAFQYLEQMYVERDESCVHIREDITFDSLRTDPRFADLLRRIGLPPV